MELFIYCFYSKKKGDPSNCNNYRGISLIHVGLKIQKKKKSQIDSLKVLFEHKFIRSEQFGFS